MKRIALLVATLFALNACSSGSQQIVSDYKLPPKISLDVQKITVVDRSGPPSPGSPYINNIFSPTISAAIKQWANDRLQATGVAGQALVIIKAADLTSQGLKTKTGIDSWFDRQQASKYTGHADVDIQVSNGNTYGLASAEARRSVSLPEDPNNLEKQDAYVVMLNGLMKDLGQNLEASIQTHLQSFVVSAPVLDNQGLSVSPAMTSPMSIEAEPLDQGTVGVR